MPVLTIRNLPADVHARLRVRAARAILTVACMESESRRPASVLQDWVDELYAARRARKVVESLIAERRREAAKE